MTLIDEIRAKCSADLIAARDTTAIAAVVSAGRTRVMSKEIGVGAILLVLQPHGGEFLDGLVSLGAQDRNAFWAMELIKAGTFDVGLDGTRAQMHALAAAIPSLAPAFGALMSLAEQPDPVTELAVRIALGPEA